MTRAEKICKLIHDDLEVGMEFDVYNTDGSKNWFSPYALKDDCNLSDKDGYNSCSILGGIVSGKYTVKIPKRMPDTGEEMSEYLVVEIIKDVNMPSNNDLYYKGHRLLVSKSRLFDLYSPANTSDFIPCNCARQINKMRLVEVHE